MDGVRMPSRVGAPLRCEGLPPHEAALREFDGPIKNRDELFMPRLGEYAGLGFALLFLVLWGSRVTACPVL